MFSSISLFLFFLFLSIISQSFSINQKTFNITSHYNVGCIYSAAYLSHISLFGKLKYHTTSTKMEGVSFVLKDAKKLFRYFDPNLYYVNHLSEYEHLIKKGIELKLRSSLDINTFRQRVEDKVLKFSLAGYHEQCFVNKENFHYSPIDLLSEDDKQQNKIQQSFYSNTISEKKMKVFSFIPYYGGLPPGVDLNTLKINSLGQGNSLLSKHIKVIQLMSTICSVYKVYSNVSIAVSNKDDFDYLTNVFDYYLPEISQDINIYLFNVQLPSFLPHVALDWTQKYIYQENCKNFYEENSSEVRISDQSRAIISEKLKLDLQKVDRIKLDTYTTSLPKNISDFIHLNELQKSDKVFYKFPETESIYNICENFYQYTMNPTYSLNFTRYNFDVSESKNDKIQNKNLWSHIYYTESDQILFHFDESIIRDVFYLTNEKFMILPTRRAKRVMNHENPSQYNILLNHRYCGNQDYTYSRDEYKFNKIA